MQKLLQGCALVLLVCFLLAVLAGVVIPGCMMATRKAAPRPVTQSAPPARLEPVTAPPHDVPPDSAQLGADYAETLRKQAQDLAPVAYGVARGRVLALLKAPSTAKFRDVFHAQYGFKQWKVGGTVEAQNPFGVFLKHNWQAVVEQQGSDWAILYLKVGDEKVGTMPDPALAPPRAMTQAEVAVAKERESARKAAVAARQAASDAALLKSHQELAAQGDAYGLLCMGERHLSGDGVEKSQAIARKYLEQAAAKGSAAAARALDQLGPNTPSR
jgi:hypothetical protein